jgi:hypothetical protein
VEAVGLGRNGVIGYLVLVIRSVNFAPWSRDLSLDPAAGSEPVEWAGDLETVETPGRGGRTRMLPALANRATRCDLVALLVRAGKHSANAP